MTLKRQSSIGTHSKPYVHETQLMGRQEGHGLDLQGMCSAVGVPQIHSKHPPTCKMQVVVQGFQGERTRMSVEGNSVSLYSYGTEIVMASDSLYAD